MPLNAFLLLLRPQHRGELHLPHLQACIKGTFLENLVRNVVRPVTGVVIAHSTVAPAEKLLTEQDALSAASQVTAGRTALLFSSRETRGDRRRRQTVDPQLHFRDNRGACTYSKTRTCSLCTCQDKWETKRLPIGHWS